MRTEIAPPTHSEPTRLSDYKAPNFTIESVFLDFDLSHKKTTVKSELKLKRNASGPLVLDGEDITLKSVTINGKSLKRDDYKLTQSQLILNDVPDVFTLEIVNTCNPASNSKLMGLYVSGGRYFTQCEAEGFRRITYYMDRPDVLSVFRVKITAPKAENPFLLANGNCVEEGDLPDGKHFAVWEDPFPKPCYLFALVAGEFDILEDDFTTMRGRHIPLTIYVDPGDASRALYAMDALKRSMKWDEEAFGREYDLDRFMIVAVRDFNFGAMENKGLNIFNSALLLADAESATDFNFERIESVVAHEYFHNWTGNRITCRDWFQLCLKEGFTVFRDQEFSAHERGASVQRIKDVRALRSRQFPEDAGPLAHPVRPSEYMKIDNFYTATIYEKGAELIRMLKTVLGAEEFRKGCDYYFESLDGTASTIEQFIACFEHISGKDLSQFMIWYAQAGTPELTMRSKQSDEGLTVTFSQKTKPTPGQAKKSNCVIPIRWQLIGDDGPVSDPQLTILNTKTVSITIKTPIKDVTPSILQDFSAPVTLKSDYTAKDRLRLMASDPNSFTRWEAGQSLARKLICDMASALQKGKAPATNKALKRYTNALKVTLENSEFDNSFKDLILSTPSDAEIFQNFSSVDPIAVNLACKWLSRAVSDALAPQLIETYHTLKETRPFNPTAEAVGRRALKNRALSLLGAGRHSQTAQLAISQFKTADNMTDELSALMTLTRLGGRRVEQSMNDFFDKWKDNPLVIDKWFSVQSARPHSEGIEALRKLTKSEPYKARNPNRVRALVGGFAMSNPLLFHALDGSGYDFFTDQVLDMDVRNPQVAARLVGVYEIWRKLDVNRQNLIREHLTHIIASQPSRNVLEIATKVLG